MAFLIATLVLHQAMGSGQPCFPELFPPWLPKVFAYHNNVESVAVRPLCLLICIFRLNSGANFKHNRWVRATCCAAMGDGVLRHSKPITSSTSRFSVLFCNSIHSLHSF